MFVVRFGESVKQTNYLNEMAVVIIIGIITLLLVILITTLCIVFSGDGAEERILENVCIKKEKFNKEFLIQNNLDKLRLNDNSTDIELIAQSVAFRAHKLILAAHSKYLATMLYTYTQGHLNVTDSNQILQLELGFIDHNTLETVLGFIYGKSIPLAVFENENDYTKLLKTSDEFQLDALKCEVSKKLGKKLNKTNVSNLIVLAEETDSPFLMNLASNYLLNNLNDVRSTNEWKMASKINGHILANAIDFHGKLPANTTCIIECQSINFQSMSIINNLRRFFTTNYMADANITVTNEKDEHEFHINKAILTGQSEQFRQQFAGTTNIEIDGVDHLVMREFLMYMYSGWIVSLNKYAEGLLHLSNVYGMLALRDKCEDVIIDQLSVKNAANIVELLSRIESKRLSNAVLDFILKNRKDVVQTDGWKSLKNNKPELLNKIFSNI